MKFTKFNNPFHPGEILLEDFIVPMGISQRQFAAKIGWTPRKLNEIVKGKRGLTAATAIDLSEFLNTTPEFWMNIQRTWDLAQEYKNRKVS